MSASEVHSVRLSQKVPPFKQPLAMANSTMHLCQDSPLFPVYHPPPLTFLNSPFMQQLLC